MFETSYRKKCRKGKPPGNSARALGVLTCSLVAVAAEVLRSRLPSQTRGGIVTGKDVVAIDGGAPVAFINTQSVQCTARFA